MGPGQSQGKLSVKTYSDAGWFSECLAEVRSASSVDVATFLFDDPEFTQVLLQRLKDRTPFSCRVFVDAEGYEQRSSRYQRPRLEELRRNGAEVSLSRGYDATGLYGKGAHKGLMHFKAIILDGKVAYAGGANVTKKARANREFMFRFTGHPVADIKKGVSDMAAHAETLKSLSARD